MDILYPAFTIAMAVVSILCGIHAWRHDDHVLFVSAIVYGLLMEKLVIVAFDTYTYPAAKMLDAFGIPIAIGFGWGVVIYSGYVTARRFELSPRHIPLFAGVYALHMDFAMDTIAIRVPYWQWLSRGDWFGVPLGNYVGWFLVALLFTYTYHAVSTRTRNPFLIGAGSIFGAIVLLLPALELWTRVTGDSVLREILILGTLVGVSLFSLARTTWTPRPVSHLITAAVFSFHGFFLAVLLVLGLHTTQPVLLLLSVAMIAIGVGIHGWPYLQNASPHRPVGPNPE